MLQGRQVAKALATEEVQEDKQKVITLITLMTLTSLITLYQHEDQESEESECYEDRDSEERGDREGESDLENVEDARCSVNEEAGGVAYEYSTTLPPLG